MFKTNYHTHTTFCDGNDSIDELVQKAISLDFKYLGFSSHSMYPFSSTWHIPPANYKKYAAAVTEAKEKYNSKLPILLGFEADYVPSVSSPDFSTYKSMNPDYLIGSVHYIFTDKGRLAVDYGAEKLKSKIESLFNGNAKKMVQEYFYLQREMLSKANFTILGHADLVRKNNGLLKMFNESESWYRKEIKATAKAIKKADVVVEINTGAIARGYMDNPYPSFEFLEILNSLNVPVIFGSDCHNKDFLDCNFDNTVLIAKKAGYKEMTYLDEKAGLRFQKIDL